LTVSPGALADVLAALPVQVSEVSVRRATVSLDDYPGGPRPSSVVVLSGRGRSGFGENVAFTDEEHARFAARAGALVRRPSDGRGGTGRVDTLVDPEARGYERAALEAALVDLALRQAGTTLAALTGVTRMPLRVVTSFAACANPAERARQLRASGHTEDLKVDVDPAWDSRVQAALAAEPGIAILDFKGRGEARLADELSTLFPEVIFEDPPAGTRHTRIARDASLADAGAVAAALTEPAAVNLKAPRMGGPLEVLRGLALATRARLPAYLGGMFEVGVGRTQARQLAALFCPEAPNDLAPIRNVGAIASEASTGIVIRFDTPGFG
jgi:L-alanine-DL-glutamate epimerase-like enolase superfamily enzyme